MAWHRVYGNSLDAMNEMYQRTGVMPTGLLNQPHVKWPLQIYLKGYLDLNGRRQMGQAAMQPLSPLDIISYGRVHGFSGDMRFFYRVVTELDDEYLKGQAAELKSKQQSAKSKPGKKGHR